jgi:hypothetical protein
MVANPSAGPIDLRPDAEMRARASGKRKLQADRAASWIKTDMAESSACAQILTLVSDHFFGSCGKTATYCRSGRFSRKLQVSENS